MKKEKLIKQMQELIENQKPLDPDIQKIVNDHFWELITKTPDKKVSRPITVEELIKDLQNYASSPDNGGINPKMYVKIDKDRLLFGFPKGGFLSGCHNGSLRMTKEVVEDEK